MTTNPLDFSDPRLCIGEAAFAGSGATSRDSSEYEALEQWIRRLETEGPAAVDWPEVVRLATTILEARGKDLVVGCWLAYGLFHAEGYRGLAVGLGILRGLVLHHWETMQPPVTRKRARIGAVEWLAGRAAHLCQAEPDAEEAGAVLYAFAALGEIEQAIGERLPKDPVSLRDLTRGLAPKREAIRRAQEQARRQRQEQEEEEAARARLPVPTPAPPAPPRPAPPVLDPKALDALPETMKTLAAGLLAADTTDARAYTLSRVASWSRIRQLPPHDGGRTGAMPPVEEATTLRDLCQRGENAAALIILNDLVWSAPFWFEGHRITAELLLRSGPDHADAHAAVCGAMPLLLRRFPALVTFTFADGTPLAEAETQTWLMECGGSASPPDGLDRALKEVRQLMAAGKGREAVDRMAALTEESGSGRDRLLRQIAQARFCLDVGLVAAALPLLDHLDQMLEAHGLESWEPSLAAQVAELRFRALTHPDAFKLVPEDRRRLGLDLTRQRLVRLDFATAARLFR